MQTLKNGKLNVYEVQEQCEPTERNVCGVLDSEGPIGANRDSLVAISRDDCRLLLHVHGHRLCHSLFLGTAMANREVPAQLRADDHGHFDCSVPRQPPDSG